MKSIILKSFVLLVFLAFGIATIIGIDKTLRYEEVEPNLIAEVKAKGENGYLDSKILEAIHTENFDDVVMYQNLADLGAVELKATTLAQIEAHDGVIEKGWRNTKEFTSGFLSGEAKSIVGMSGSIASDLTVYGDLRDLKNEGVKYKDGEDYDEFILTLSMIGVGLSASQLLSIGVTTPLKLGASVVKLAHKAGTLTKPFLAVVSKKLTKTIDIKILKNLEFSIFHIGSTTKAISKSIDIKPIRGLLTDINRVQKHTSIPDTVSLLKYVDNTKELKSLGKVSKQFKGNTKGIVTLLGKSALRSGKLAVKYSAELIAMIIGFVFSFLGFMVTVSMRGFFRLPKKSKFK